MNSNPLAAALAALRGTPAVVHPKLCGPYANLLAAVVSEEGETVIAEARGIYRRRIQEVVATVGAPEVTPSPAAKRLLNDVAWALEAPNVIHGGVLALREALSTYDRTWSQS